MSGTPPKPGNLIVWDASTYAVMRRDERPFARHLAVATLPRGRVLTADAYAIRIWTPRPLGTVASEPPTIAHRRKDPVNLLALVAREPQKSWGKWPTRDGALESPGTRYARLQIPYAAPSDYRIDMKVELVGKEPDQPLGLGLVVGGRHTEIVIDKLLAADGRQARSLVKNGRYSGVDDVDGVPVPFGLNAHHGQLLFPSRPVQLAVTVRPDSIRLTCDGTSVVDWNGDPKGLIPQEHWNWIDSNSLFLSSYGSIRIHEMTLTPLPAARP